MGRSRPRNYRCEFSVLLFSQRDVSCSPSPACCSFRMPMICSSVNLDRFIVCLLCKEQTKPNSRTFQGSRSPLTPAALILLGRQCRVEDPSPMVICCPSSAGASCGNRSLDGALMFVRPQFTIALQRQVADDFIQHGFAILAPLFFQRNGICCEAPTKRGAAA